MADRSVAAASHRAVELGAVSPAGSRQLGRRSAVTATEELVVAGLADGAVVGFDPGLETCWRNEAADRGSVVSLTPFADGVLAGERGADGEVRFHDADTGAVRWRYRTADDVGDPQQETRFSLPFVVDAVVGGDRAFVASRRYDRGDDGDRNFDSVVHAFTPSGEVAWQYQTDASTVSLDADRDSDRVAVGFNRCPGEHADGLVVLDAGSGEVRRRWDPPGDGQRRVGDVSLVEDGVVVSSHADYRGYRLDGDGVRWAVDLGRPVERGGDRVYAYPNHVHETADGAVFVTGNTYPEDGRETDVRHPNEHTAVGVAPDGSRRFASSVGGFAHELATREHRVAIPVAQHFRNRDAAGHGLRVVDLASGQVGAHDAAGVLTSAALTDGAVYGMEEPVSYHDDSETRGAYRLHQYRC
jgi:outer membrane protein assembly factor BamB